MLGNNNNLFKSLRFCLLLALLLALSALAVAAGDDDKICISPNNVYTVIVDPYTLERGYYRFKECGDVTNPTIGIEIGKAYIFDQADRTNFMHPLGFAYFPDGAHVDLDELEPGISLTGSSCVESFSCPSPRYFKNGRYLGQVYSENFGLEDYEPQSHEWSADRHFVELRFDDYHYNKDLFYFCHIHPNMSGRIKLLKDGVPIMKENDPPLNYSQQVQKKKNKTKSTIMGLDDIAQEQPVTSKSGVNNVSIGFGIITMLAIEILLL